MKFFIDTANLEQIREANALGVLDGVTTNPSLMAKEVLRELRTNISITSRYVILWMEMSAPKSLPPITKE